MRSRIFILLGMTLVLVFTRVESHAQTVPLDPNFGTGGVVWPVMFPGYSAATCCQSIVALGDGRFVVGMGLGNGVPGNEDIGFIRFNGNGSIDTTFGTNGYVVVNFDPALTDALTGRFAFDTNGRIILGGQSHLGATSSWAIAVLSPAGQLDSNFSGDGMLTIPHAVPWSFISDVVLDESGNIIVAGNIGTDGGSNVARVVRVSSTGVVDDTFTDEWANSRRPQIARDNSGRIVVVAMSNSSPSTITIVRKLATGAYDTSFDGDGALTDALPETMQNVLIQADNKIVVVAGSGGIYHATRYLESGTLDSSFGVGGRFSINITDYFDEQPYASLIDFEGRLIMGGYAASPTTGYDFTFVRLTTIGQLDATFGTGGIIRVNVFDPFSHDVGYQVALMPDGDLIMVGSMNPPSDIFTGLLRLDLGDPAELIQNPSFETADSTQAGNAQKWTGANLTKDKRTCNTISPPVNYSHTGNCAFLFKGGSGEKSQISQTIKPDAALRQAGTALTLSAWVEGAPNYVLGKVVVYYTDGTKQAFSVAMGPALSYTQFTSAPFFLAKNASKFKVSFKHTYPSGKLYLDDVALIPNAARRNGVLPVPAAPFAAESWRGR